MFSSSAIPSAMSLWAQNLPLIHKHSKQYYDTSYDRLSDLTAETLNIITPRLPSSTMTMPRDWSAFRHVLELVYNRLKYLRLSKESKNKTEQPPNPIRIVVLGGSVTFGMGPQFYLQAMGVSLRKLVQMKELRWSNILSQLINNMVKDVEGLGNEEISDLVEVHNIAVGGRNSVSILIRD